MSGIIDPQNVSFDTIKQDLIDYIQSREDYANWQNFLDSGVGTTIEELLAGLGTFASFHSMGANRESRLEDAIIYNSVIKMCNMLGYSVNRVMAPIVILNIVVSDTVYWDRMNPIAYYGNKPICLAQSQYLTAGSAGNIISCYVGEWVAYELTASDTRKFVRVLIEDTGVDNVLSRLELTVNGELITLVRYAEEAISTNVGIVTHPDGVILVFGDDYVYRQMRKNDVIVFTYIRTEGNLGVNSLIVADVAPEVGNILSITVDDRGSDRDEIQKLKTVASGFHASMGRMVTPKDHTSIFLSYSGDLISAGYRSKAGYCCTSEISYLYADEHIMTPTEEINILSYLDSYRIIGELIEFVNPIKVCLDFQVTVITERGTDSATIEAQISDLIELYSLQLNSTFRPGIIVDGISALTGVKRVYLEQPVSDHVMGFNEYLKLETLVVTILDENATVSITPSNDGYTYCT